jgi:hypothetical protein
VRGDVCISWSSETGNTRTAIIGEMLFSGHDKSSERMGSTRLVDDNIVCFRRKKKNINMNVIQCYVPTNDHDEDSKDVIYQKPQAILNMHRHPERRLQCKGGSDNMGYEEVIGQACSQIHMNGNKLPICVD